MTHRCHRRDVTRPEVTLDRTVRLGDAPYGLRSGGDLIATAKAKVRAHPGRSKTQTNRARCGGTSTNEGKRENTAPLTQTAGKVGFLGTASMRGWREVGIQRLSQSNCLSPLISWLTRMLLDRKMKCEWRFRNLRPDLFT
jgi:hypothetical protein